MADYSTPYKAKENTGNLFDNRYKETKAHPDQTGTMVLSKELLKELVERVKEGKEAKVSVSAWKNTSKSGKNYLAISVKVFTEYKKDSGDIEVPF